MRTFRKNLLNLLLVMFLGLTSAFAGGVDYSAYVIYGENADFTMPGIIANLYNSNGEFIASTLTDQNGVFSFNDLDAGQNYSVHFVADFEPFGIDMADAFALLNYLNGNAELSELQLSAADVNGDTQVNYADFAFIVSQWYLRGESFPAGDWVMPVWTFTTQSFKSVEDETGPDGPITIVSTSDISDTPPPVKKHLLNSIKEFSYLDNYTNIDIPISFAANQEIYGMGLEMAFDNANIEIIALESIFNETDYVNRGNSFKMSWVDYNGESIAANESFVTLKVRINTQDDVEAVLSELAKAQFVGADGSLLQDVQLNMPMLKKSIEELNFGNAYPNPANNEISLIMSQPFSENLDLEIYNLSGQLVKRIKVSPQNSKITFSTSDLPNGSYLCSMNINAKPEVKLINVQH